LLLRETNVLPLTPFFVGSVLRRERRALWLVAGGALGVLLRIAGAALAFGDPLYLRDHGYGFSAQALLHNAPLVLFALCGMVPLGLPAALLQRGRRSVELLAAVLLCALFFASYSYSAEESGRFKQLVLGPRYFLPLVPLLALALARVHASVLGRLASGSGGLRAAARIGARVWVALILAGAVAVHPVLQRYGAEQRAIVAAIYSATAEGSALLFDPTEAGKYVSELYGARVALDRETIAPAQLQQLVSLRGASLISLQRTDSAFHRERASADERFLETLRRECALAQVADLRASTSLRVRVLRLERCAP
jgi:hypothetical protein